MLFLQRNLMVQWYILFGRFAVQIRFTVIFSIFITNMDDYKTDEIILQTQAYDEDYCLSKQSFIPKSLQSNESKEIGMIVDIFSQQTNKNFENLANQLPNCLSEPVGFFNAFRDFFSLHIISKKLLDLIYDHRITFSEAIRIPENNGARQFFYSNFLDLFKCTKNVKYAELVLLIHDDTFDFDFENYFQNFIDDESTNREFVYYRALLYVNLMPQDDVISNFKFWFAKYWTKNDVNNSKLWHCISILLALLILHNLDAVLPLIEFSNYEKLIIPINDFVDDFPDSFGELVDNFKDRMLNLGYDIDEYGGIQDEIFKNDI